MRSSLVMLAAASTIVVCSHLVGRDDPEIARRDLEAEVARIRPLVMVASPAMRATDDKTAALRLNQLDQALMHLVRTDERNGAPWMWDAGHRDELTALVHRAAPVLESMTEWAKDRRGRAPIPILASLLQSRHRTNLLCATAVIETDAVRRRALLGVALDLALAADEGGVIAGMVQHANAGIVALAVRTTQAERGRDDLLVAALRPRLERVIDDPWQPRAVHDIVEMVDRRAHVEMDIREVKRWTRFLVTLQPGFEADAPSAEPCSSISEWPEFLRVICSNDSQNACRRYLEI